MRIQPVQRITRNSIWLIWSELLLLDYPGIVHPLDGVQWAHDKSSGMYEYFIKVVPTIYTDKRGRKIHSNQYSVTEYFREDNAYPRPPPGVYFIYDFSPIKLSLD